MVLVYIVASVFLVSIVSLVGVFSIFFKEQLLDKIMFYLVSFAAGSLLGAAFLDLLPEISAKSTPLALYASVLLGILLFFIIEKFLRWHHHHKGHCNIHPVAYLNLIGDAVHNFIDGAILAAAFLVDVHLGITTTFAVIAHEIPQELGDFSILLYSGFSKARALFYNFLSALISFFGALIVYTFSITSTSATTFLVAFAAGAFIYIALADILPELQKEISIKKSSAHFLFCIIGILIIWFLKLAID